MHVEPSLGSEESDDALQDTGILQKLVPEWRCRVLIVDDDDIVLAHLSALLKKAHYDIDVASSAEAALKILDVSQYQIVVTDWQMPGMDGLELCRRIRQREVDGYIYVMMITVRESKQDMLVSMQAGADDFIVKGSSVEEILARMEVARRITHLEFSLRLSNRENRRLSVTDPLTTAHNRRYMMKFLPRELARARRYHHPLAVLCCDIDGFKEVNDRLGHSAGDLVLQEFVARARQCIRDASDWLARSGGDEFVIVMPETNLEGANRVAAKLRHILVNPPLVLREQQLKVTVSIGAMALESPRELSSTTTPELLRMADLALYRSKRAAKAQLAAAAARDAV